MKIFAVYFLNFHDDIESRESEFYFCEEEAEERLDFIEKSMEGEYYDCVERGWFTVLSRNLEEEIPEIGESQLVQRCLEDELSGLEITEKKKQLIFFSGYFQDCKTAIDVLQEHFFVGIEDNEDDFVAAIIKMAVKDNSSPEAYTKALVKAALSKKRD